MLLSFLQERSQHLQVIVINLRSFFKPKKQHFSPELNIPAYFKQDFLQKPKQFHFKEISDFMLRNGYLERSVRDIEKTFDKDNGNLVCVFSQYFPYKLLGVIRYGDIYTRDEIHIEEVVVSVECRRMGLGKLMMLYAINHVNLIGIKKITLENMPNYAPTLVSILKSLLREPLKKHFDFKISDKHYQISKPSSKGNFYSALGFRETREVDMLLLELGEKNPDFKKILTHHRGLRKILSASCV